MPRVDGVERQEHDQNVRARKEFVESRGGIGVHAVEPFTAPAPAGNVVAEDLELPDGVAAEFSHAHHTDADIARGGRADGVLPEPGALLFEKVRVCR